MKIQYQADDGRLFSNEKACLEYEQRKAASERGKSCEGCVRLSDLDGVVPLSNHGIAARFYTWYEVHNVGELKALLMSYGHTGDVSEMPHFLPDVVCISSNTPTDEIQNIFFRHSLEDEVYKFWVEQMHYDRDCFRRLISDRQLVKGSMDYER